MMTPAERFERVRELFVRVVDAPVGERAALARELAGGDESLAAEVIELLGDGGGGGGGSNGGGGGGPSLGGLLEVPLAAAAALRGVAAAGDATPTLLQPPGPVGGYRVQRVLGEGGMGVVWLAHDPVLGRDVAIKVLRPGLAGGAAGRMLREASAAARLNHPNSVAIYHVLADGGKIHIVMERLGRSLADEVRERGGPLAWPAATRAVRDAAAGLAAAHAIGLVHRDVKPSNLLRTPQGAIKVVDFGIVHSPDGATLTVEGSVLGTPGYMAPEQCRGLPADARSDVYALACTWFHLLAGRPPFDGPTAQQVIDRHCRDPFPDPRLAAPGLPAAAAAVLARAAEKDPARRYADAGAMLADLDAVLRDDDGDARAARPPSWAGGSPFRGLAAFEFEHAAVFFGRGRAVAAAVAALRERAAAGRAFLLVTGLSGCGKSSLVRAGVFPAVVRGDGTGGGGGSLWRRAALRPGDAGGDVFRALADALLAPDALPELGADGTAAADLAAALRANPPGAAALVKGGLSQAAAEHARANALPRQPEARLAVLIDQLEELFTSPAIAAADRGPLVAAVAALADGGRAFVIATLRSDYYHRCQEVPELAALKAGAGTFDLGPPTPAEVGQMIDGPAAAAGLRFEADPAAGGGGTLADVLRDAAAGAADALPLLEFALDELYARAVDADGGGGAGVDGGGGRVLTFAAYRAIGGVEGAIARRAEGVYAALPADVRAALPRVFRGLVAVGGGGGGGDGAAARDLDWAAVDADPAAAAFARAFVDARLLAAGRAADGRAVVRVAHESLLRAWPRVQDWLAADRDLLRVRGRVGAGAARWAAEGRRADLLLPDGRPLAEGRALVAAMGPELIDAERAFVEQSGRRARRRTRAKRAVLVLLVLGFVGTTVGLIGQARARREADRQRGVAERQEAIAVRQTVNALGQERRAKEERDRAVDQAYFASIAGAGAFVDRNEMANARRLLSEAPEAKRGWEWGYLLAQSDGCIAALAGHESAVAAAAFSSDGTRVVTASEDRTARVWDVAGGREVAVLRGHGGGVRAAAFSPDGTRVVTASADATARVWDAATGRELAKLRGHESNVVWAAFGPGGARVVTASWDKTARVWDAASGREVAALRGHDDLVHAAAFSADGARIVTASLDKTARVWDAATGRELAVLRGHEGTVVAAAFARDGARVVTASWDKTARVWDAASGLEIAVMRGHARDVTAAAFDPAGARVVTASLDRTARVWDAATGRELAVLRGHESAVTAAAFGADGARVLTASADSTARVWDAATGRELAVLRGHGAAVASAAFGPDGSRVVTASTDKTARLWDATAGRESAALRGHESTVMSAEFSPEGGRVVTAAWDQTARVWDAATGRQVAVLRGHGDLVHSATFSRDGARLLTASEDRTARVWDAATGRELVVLRGHAGDVTAAALGADGTRVVTASEDRTARVWDAADGRVVATLSGHEGWVYAAAFSRDGARIVTASEDATARVWDAASGRELVALRGHDGDVNSAVFSADGTRVVTASTDSTARIWDSVPRAVRHAAGTATTRPAGAARSEPPR